MTWGIATLFLLASCAMPAAELQLEIEPPLAQSKEPFVVNPRFCGGPGGDACVRIPIPI